MTDELIKKLLEAGVHFGHQTKRWNPKMAKFIFGERSNIYIIDLEKTVEYLNQARDFLHNLALKGGRILFVGTKKQSQDVTEQEAIRARMPYVTHRWLGGLLTNFQTIRKSIDRLKSLEAMATDGTFERLSKKEVAQLIKEKDKLLRDLKGLKEMIKMPQAIFLIDSKREENAVREANKLKIPVVALLDTNCDPDPIDYPIPGNDDALKSIRLIVTLITDSIIEGRKGYLTNENLPQEVETQDGAEIDVVQIVDVIETIEDSTHREAEAKRGPTKVKLSTERKK